MNTDAGRRARTAGWAVEAIRPDALYDLGGAPLVGAGRANFDDNPRCKRDNSVKSLPGQHLGV